MGRQGGADALDHAVQVGLGQLRRLAQQRVLRHHVDQLAQPLGGVAQELQVLLDLAGLAGADLQGDQLREGRDLADRLTASYSHRLQRPRPEDFNPFRQFLDPQNVRAGNPQLKPQETHAFELGYEHRKDATFYTATLFYRQNEKSFTEVVEDLGGGAFLTTRENLSQSRSAGLELVANRRLARNLTYNLSGSLLWMEIDAARLGFGDRRSAVALSGRANLNWQATPNDFIQLNVFANGKSITPQGHRDPIAVLNLGYRRKLNERLSLVVTAQDLLHSLRQGLVIDTPELRQQIIRKVNSRSLHVALVWSFGGARQREPGFEFSSGPS